MLKRILCAAVLLHLAAMGLWAAVPFTVVVYNAENLHDADGVAVYDDYQPELYSPRHLASKVNNTAALLKRFRGGKGPDIILLQEIEIDQTPKSSVEDVDAFLEEWRGTPLSQMLDVAELPPSLRGVPAEVWLLKGFEDAGLTGYHMAVGADQPSPAHVEYRKAIKNVTLSKFPIREVRQHRVEQARVILETEIEVAGQTLYIFNNHWKSGAGDAQQEKVRVGNARVLRDRVKEILKADPQADIIIGGDLNSHYNQKIRYPRMAMTGIDDVLKVGHSEPELRRGKAPLYNLWYELEPQQRGSDTYRGEWGTLMHLIISRGLHDWNGIQYQDNSFRVARLPGVNSDAAGVPVRWSNGGAYGFGYSDHLPIYAHFRAVDKDLPDKYMPLENASDTPPTADVMRINYAGMDLSQAIDVRDLPADADLQDGSWTGKLFKVSGQPSVNNRNLRVRLKSKFYDVYSHSSAIREALKRQATLNRKSEFYGQLGTYKGKWQFVVHDMSWIQ
jgi:hypothetical protein